MGPQGPWSVSYVKNNKLMIAFFAKPDFLINGSGVSFGQVTNLLQFFPHHMIALPVYMCLGFQASYNLERQITSYAYKLM